MELDGILALSTFLGVILMSFGVFGRPSHDRPHCVRCRADVRALAWTASPVCACGAALDHPGAVRSVGRVRRPRFIWVGLAVWLLSLGLIAETVRLRAAKESWAVWLPDRFVVSRAVAGDAWAFARLPEIDISPEVAGELLTREASGLISLPKSSPISQASLLQTWGATRPNADVVMPAILKVLIRESVAADGRATLVLDTSSLDSPSTWVVRVEAMEFVTSDDAPAQALTPDDWTLTAWRPPAYSSAGKRSFTGTASMSFALPKGRGVGDQVRITLIAGSGPLALGLVGSPLFDGEAPPADDLPLATGRATLVVPLGAPEGDHR